MIEDDAAKNSLQNIDKQAENTGKGFGKLGGLAGAMGAAVAAAGAAAVAGLAVLGAGIAKTGIQYNAMAEQSEVAWTTLLGTQEEAKDMMQQISDFTKATPFETADIDMMAKYMHNAGLEGKGLFDELMKVSDVSSAFAIPAAEAKEMTRQMSQVRQAGVAYTEDLNILQDRGVPIYKAIAEQLGITTGEVKQMASEGKLTSEIYIGAFNDIANGVKGASEAQSQTFLGMISTLKDNFAILSGTIMEPFFNLMKEAMPVIIGMVEGLTTAFENNGWEGVIEKVFPPPVADFLMTTFANLKTLVGEVFTFLKEQFSSTGTMTNTVFPAVRAVFETAFNAIKAVITTVWEFIKNSLLPIFTNLFNWVKDNMPAIRETVSAVFNKIREVVSGVWAFFKDNLLPILVSLLGWVQDNMPKIQKIIETAFNIIKNVVKTAWDIFENLLLPVLKLLWAFIEPTIPKIGKIIDSAFQTIIEIVEDTVVVFDKVSSAIQKAIDWLTFWDNKEVSPKTVEVNEKYTSSGSDVDQNATGTNYFQGGRTLVGERGPELVTLPRGTKIDPANDTRNKIGQSQTIVVQPGAINISASSVKEFNDLVDLFKRLPQVARQY